MKTGIFLFLTALGLMTLADRPVDGQEPADGWAKFFPDIAGCERTVAAFSETADFVTQSAGYKRDGGLCFTVTFAFDRSGLRARRGTAELARRFNVRKTAFAGYPAYRIFPLCGNDRSPGSLIIYIDRDKTVTIASYEYRLSTPPTDGNAGDRLFETAKAIDLAALKTEMESGRGKASPR